MLHLKLMSFPFGYPFKGYLRILYTFFFFYSLISKFHSFLKKVVSDRISQFIRIYYVRIFNFVMIRPPTILL